MAKKRKVINAKDLNTNELVYFKGHAKATYMSDGSTVEDGISKKQDIISDLDTIRTNASLATTALQSVPEEYITETELEQKGYLTEHQDISGKQDKLVSGTNIKTINGESIIGEGDIVISAGSELTSVDWEDIQNKPEISITDVGDLKINSNASVDIKGEYGITLIGGIYFEAGNSDYIGIVKNNTQLNWNSNGIQLIDTNDDGILGISCTGDGTKFLSNDGTYKEISGSNGAYAEVSHGTSDTTFTLTPNTFHIWDEVNSLTLTLGEETTGVANEYLFQFTSGSEPTVLTLPDNIVWANDEIPEIESTKIYQVSILNNIATYIKTSYNIKKQINALTITIYPRMSTFAMTEPEDPRDDDMVTYYAELAFDFPVASEINVYLKMNNTTVKTVVFNPGDDIIVEGPSVGYSNINTAVLSVYSDDKYDYIVKEIIKL